MLQTCTKKHKNKVGEVGRVRVTVKKNYWETANKQVNTPGPLPSYKIPFFPEFTNVIINYMQLMLIFWHSFGSNKSCWFFGTLCILYRTYTEGEAPPHNTIQNIFQFKFQFQFQFEFQCKKIKKIFFSQAYPNIGLHSKYRDSWSGFVLFLFQTVRELEHSFVLFVHVALSFLFLFITTFIFFCFF